MDELKVTAEKIGGVWHGYAEGFPEVDEQALTEDIALRKARQVATRIMAQKAIKAESPANPARRSR